MRASAAGAYLAQTIRPITLRLLSRYQTHGRFDTHGNTTASRQISKGPEHGGILSCTAVAKRLELRRVFRSTTTT